jgi:hypothetical protein
MEHHIFLMGKVTISMAIFNSYVSLPEGKQRHFLPQWMSLFWGGDGYPAGSFVNGEAVRGSQIHKPCKVKGHPSELVKGHVVEFTINHPKGGQTIDCVAL